MVELTDAVTEAESPALPSVAAAGKAPADERSRAAKPALNKHFFFIVSFSLLLSSGCCTR